MKITCFKNGPYLIEMGSEVIEITDESGNAKTTVWKGPVALCRCGMSATKPFCDGQHKHVGFEAEYTELDERGEL